MLVESRVPSGGNGARDTRRGGVAANCSHARLNRNQIEALES